MWSSYRESREEETLPQFHKSGAAGDAPTQHQWSAYRDTGNALSRFVILESITVKEMPQRVKG
jgi:hypothetical protein